jgi:hypothetical protein
MISTDLTNIHGAVRRVDPRPVHHSLDEFEVTTDSVVAKVRVATTQSTRRVFIDWGDDTNDSLWTLPGRLPVRHGPAEPLPQGTFEFFHAYALPEDRWPFDRTLLLHVESVGGSDDIRLKTVHLVPRFRVTHYRTYVRLLGPCDLAGSTSELRIEQSVGGNAHGAWEWEPSNNFFSEGQYHVLDGSQLAVEVTTETNPNEPEYTEPVVVRFDITEKDPGPDQHGSYSATIASYNLGQSETVQVDRSVAKFVGSCKVRLRYDREVALIAELPSAGGWATFDAAPV